MINVIKKEIDMEESLRKRLEIICDFCNIIELGDKKYWDTKDMDFKKRMTNIFKQQVIDLENMLPTLK